ncbi:hypothetical protein M514_12478 [Trichuris suis]|uniref:Uncharacterized protein n=1 Tax=Trichuris suis TaxID=68888 RepID=A0A085LNS7_9BILA|nr:hypothetical protein M513_12478 [Trichuris suis]KFD61519.1 hypothetical protein M514_12478 [Trichuris suis]
MLSCFEDLCAATTEGLSTLLQRCSPFRPPGTVTQKEPKEGDAERLKGRWVARGVGKSAQRTEEGNPPRNS